MPFGFLLSGVGLKILAVAAIAAALAMFVWQIRESGKDALRATMMEKTIEAIKDAKAIDDGVATASDADVDERLSKWFRNDR